MRTTTIMLTRKQRFGLVVVKAIKFKAYACDVCVPNAPVGSKRASNLKVPGACTRHLLQTWLLKADCVTAYHRCPKCMSVCCRGRLYVPRCPLWLGYTQSTRLQEFWSGLHLFKIPWRVTSISQKKVHAYKNSGAGSTYLRFRGMCMLCLTKRETNAKSCEVQKLLL